ncbi:S8 family peptidase [Aquisphaera giovannonii]|uniref:S8 family peptidase n=1 Tax=Aquisphaera giovannonii TaxID=406548 RepID=UPI0021BC6CEB|nr:S8 family peptidase [Aquisphaera giovannonii]
MEGLERRALLAAAAPGLPLLVKLDTLSPASLTAWLADKGVSVSATDLPQVMAVSGPDASLTGMAPWLRGAPGLGYVERSSAMSVDQVPNDPSYASNSLWGLNGAYGIGAPAAWNVTTGSTAVVVADIDTGADYNHPDLYQNIWINNAEIPASRLKNLKDEDGDGRITFYDLNYATPDGSHPNQGAGKITDINGDGRIDGADLLAPMKKNADGTDAGSGGWADGISQDGDTSHVDDLIGWNFVTDTNDPFDDNGHGTHTAGTIGAIGNNGTGVTGVNWNVQVMPLKFLDSSGNGSDLAAAEALRYAADHGARVSNNSYGGGDGGSTLGDTITYAAGKGDVFVAAAGNSGANTDSTANYPSGYANDNIIAVAAIDSSGARAGFSNYGATTVDLGAPGVNILSTYPKSRYATMSGTSMATPHVTGTVALLLAVHPGWTYSQLIHQVLSTATPDASLAGKTVTGGILNASAALGAPTTTSPFVGANTTARGNWQGAFGADGYSIPRGASALPSYAAVSTSGASLYTWSTTTTDARALSVPGSTSARLATCWYSPTSFTIDVNLTDGQAHKVSLYLLDWDSTSRSEQVQVVDASTGVALDARSASSFNGGTYLTWNLSGHVKFVVSRSAGANAVVSGLFFGGAPATSSPFVGANTTAKGNWQGAFGADGYSIPRGASALPSYAAVSPSGASLYTWSTTTTDARALSVPGSTSARLATCWYSPTSFTIDVNLTDGQAHKVSLYLLDWDSTSRSEQVQVVDASTGAVLDTRSASSFNGGTYLTWSLSGHVKFVVSRTGGDNAVVSGLFFG